MDNGFNSPTTDEPLAGNPRVHEEGRQYYERNNKSSDWFAHSNQIPEVKPESRLRSDAAKANALKSRGSVQEDLKQNHTADTADVKPEAPEHIDTVKREDINNHIEHHSNFEATPKSVPKQVKSAETEEHREREQNSSSVSVSNGSSATTPDLEQPPPPPPTRLALSGGDNSEKYKGESVVKTNGNKTPRESKQGRLHQESTGSGWDQSPPHHRLRADGEGIARKNKTDSITEIILQNTNSPEVKAHKAVKNVPETYTPRKPPQPRVRPDGLQNLQKAMNHSEMSAIMHGSPVEATPPRPNSGRKTLPHMQRSELW